MSFRSQDRRGMHAAGISQTVMVHDRRGRAKAPTSRAGSCRGRGVLRCQPQPGLQPARSPADQALGLTAPARSHVDHEPRKLAMVAVGLLLLAVRGDLHFQVSGRKHPGRRARGSDRSSVGGGAGQMGRAARVHAGVHAHG
jgi:hypothetical protein